jgi:hypothetical protein
VPPNLWVMLFGNPSTGRSPILKAAWAPLVHIQSDDLEKWQKAKKAWKQEPEETRGEEPSHRQLYTSSTTFEGIRDILLNQDRGVGVFRDEYSGLVAGIQKYNQGGGAKHDMAFFLESAYSDEVGR